MADCLASPPATWPTFSARAQARPSHLLMLFDDCAAGAHCQDMSLQLAIAYSAWATSLLLWFHYTPCSAASGGVASWPLTRSLPVLTKHTGQCPSLPRAQPPLRYAAQLTQAQPAHEEDVADLRPWTLVLLSSRGHEHARSTTANT